MTPLILADAITSVRPSTTSLASGRFVQAWRCVPPAVAMVCAALCAAGCGGSQSTPPFNVATARSNAVRFVACVRAHGVSNMPDPQWFHSGGKTGIVIPDPSTGVAAPQFKSAEHACKALQSRPAVSNASQASSTQAQRLKQALAFAACMRSHGAPHFPDPNSRGVFTSKLDASVPQVQAAYQDCQKTLPTGADPLSGGPVPAS